MQSATELFALFADVTAGVKEITVHGHVFHVRQINALERDEYFAWIAANCKGDRWVGASSYMTALGLCTPTGTPLFPDPGATFRDVGTKIPSRITEGIAREVMAFNLIGADAEKALAKN